MSWLDVNGAILITLTSLLWGAFSVKAIHQREPGVERVAFSAGRSSHLYFQNATIITYDRVFTNIGHGYDRTTGVFTVPEGAAGTYVFMFHGLARLNGTIWLDLYKNSMYVVSGFAHTDHEYGTASNDAVLELKEGDRVHVQGRGDNQLFGNPHEVYSTFNGFHLYQA